MDLEGALAVARLIAELGSVDGRKRIQKIVHLLGEAGHADFKRRFILHFYGPFSRKLAAQLDFLCAAELVREEPPHEGSGAYSYRIADKDALGRLDTPEHGLEGAPPWAALAKRLNEQKTDFLEAVSTLVHLSSRGVSGQSLESEFSRTKPHLKDRFGCAKDFAESNSLIQPA